MTFFETQFYENTNEQNIITKYVYSLYICVVILITLLLSTCWYVDNFNSTSIPYLSFCISVIN